MEESQGEKKMEQRLEEAAIQGKTASLNQILGEDPLILRRVKMGCFVYTPLHVAASEGHLEFVRELLDNNKALARVLDNRRWSALHLAAANGHDKIVEVLVEANANMCLTPDGDGRNPLHLAAVEGHDSVLYVFFKKKPHWIHAFLKAIDGGGNTILHLAVMNEKNKVVELLLEKIKDQLKRKNIQQTDNPLNTINKCGCAALDILEEFKSSDQVQDFEKDKKKFQKAGALKATTLKVDELLSKRQNTLMVVASLLATMAFQAGQTPPDGEATGAYQEFIVANTIGYVASLGTIMFLVPGLPFKKKLFTRIMVLIMCLAVTSMAVTYASFIRFNPGDDDWGIISYVTMAWYGVICVLVLIHTIPLLKRLSKVSWDICMRPLMKLFMEFISRSSNPPLPTLSN
ncbi:ankyrin repeat-containing protein ITN1-like [Diospyros lotus]|uniref:ankyrin repeat-containing protein ITN1-like n=1 Tax=Diospyros lotus TaxID=55363 RepID=UPI002258646A|nr:ankyrin repeat-containing protein ITN1-like [Diospyros lotus]